MKFFRGLFYILVLAFSRDMQKASRFIRDMSFDMCNEQYDSIFEIVAICEPISRQLYLSNEPLACLKTNLSIKDVWDVSSLTKVVEILIRPIHPSGSLVELS